MMNKYVIPYTEYVGESGSFQADPNVVIVIVENYVAALTEAFRIINIRHTDYSDPKDLVKPMVWHKDDDANADEEGYIVGDPVIVAKDIKYMTVTADPDYDGLVEVLQWRTKEAAWEGGGMPHVNVVEYHSVHGQPVERYGGDIADGEDL